MLKNEKKTWSDVELMSKLWLIQFDHSWSKILEVVELCRLVFQLRAEFEGRQQFSDL